MFCDGTNKVHVLVLDVFPTFLNCFFNCFLRFLKKRNGCNTEDKLLNILDGNGITYCIIKLSDHLFLAGGLLLQNSVKQQFWNDHINYHKISHCNYQSKLPVAHFMEIVLLAIPMFATSFKDSRTRILRRQTHLAALNLVPVYQTVIVGHS